MPRAGFFLCESIHGYAKEFFKHIWNTQIGVVAIAHTLYVGVTALRPDLIQHLIFGFWESGM